MHIVPLLHSALGKAVCEEVRSILSPLPHTPRLAVDRRPKRKGKAKLAEAAYGFPENPKGRKPAVKFQKKVVVIDYM